MPPTNVMNLGLSGEYIRRLLDSGRYEKAASKLPGIDDVLICYGLNDNSRRENLAENFPKDYHELIGRLKNDHPQATLIVMTVIPYGDEATSRRLNELNAQVAKAEDLLLFDIYPRYAEELKRGSDMLNYRRFPLQKIPENRREFVKPFVVPGQVPTVEVLDNRLDAHFGHLPGWFGDRDPNFAGYHVIGDETPGFGQSEHLAGGPPHGGPRSAFGRSVNGHKGDGIRYVLWTRANHPEALRMTVVSGRRFIWA